MSSHIQERYRPEAMGANATLKGVWNQIGGFLPVTAGTLTITNESGVVVLAAYPVSAGVYVPFPAIVGGGGSASGDGKSIVALAGGASGTLLVA